MLLYAYVHIRIANFYGGGLCNSALRQPAIRRLLPVWHGRTSTCAQNTGFYANGQIRVAFRESVSVLGTFMGSSCFFLLRINGGIRLIFILKHLRFVKLLSNEYIKNNFSVSLMQLPSTGSTSVSDSVLNIVSLLAFELISLRNDTIELHCK